jgi:hypothetical protein
LSQTAALAPQISCFAAGKLHSQAVEYRPQ